ncbi:hypothetical protein Q9251_18680 [Alkalihalobacillus macyae]|uniref:hypothetical protein n=1 Tax=Guptibacillus hwajinpoensis TaxID=208199 RepID=UPI00273C61E2|nr:hypothetical protein [Alkalihalobacillus macyae]MDP4552909.1 hypothetical protein [Alkalihalobacillus macyae]
MKRSYVGVLLLSVVLLLNIILTQLMVHQFYYENYTITLVYGGLNILLFPIALLIYRKEKQKGGAHGHEQ